MSLLLAITTVVTVSVTGSITGGNSSVVGSATVTSQDVVATLDQNTYGKRPRLLVETIGKFKVEATGSIEQPGSSCSGQVFVGIDGGRLSYFEPQSTQTADKLPVVCLGVVPGHRPSVCSGSSEVACVALGSITSSRSKATGKSRSRNMRLEDEEAIMTILKLKFDMEMK